MSAAVKKPEAAVEMKFKDVQIQREGEQIIVPQNMDLAEAKEWIERRMVEEKTPIAVDESFDCHPYEGAYALQRALNKKFGFVSLGKTPGMFGPTPPLMIALEIGLGDDGTVQTVQVPWGRIQIPGVTGYIQTSIEVRENRPVFSISGQVLQGQRHVVKEIANLVRQFLREASVYRGKAFKARFPDPHSGPSLEDFCPKFIDLRNVNSGELIFSEEVEEKIDVNVFEPIVSTQSCRDENIPLKRGILLEGPYGTGKTLTAYVTAQKAVANGWTFIYLDSVNDLEQAIRFAQQYQPAVIFAEDLDQVLNGENRDEEVNGILNTIDGVETKSSEIMVVLTTNNVEKITQAMVRPGRLDAVITVTPPDAKAVERLIRHYGRGRLVENENLNEVGRALAGQIPAVIREVVERSKLASIRRRRLTGTSSGIAASDLLTAAKGMLSHLELLKPKAVDPRSELEKFGTALGQGLGVAAHFAKSNGSTDKIMGMLTEGSNGSPRSSRPIGTTPGDAE